MAITVSTMIMLENCSLAVLRALLFKTLSKVTVGPLACSQQLQIFISTHGVVPALCLSDMHLLYSPPVYVCTVLLCQDTMKWHEFCATFPDVVPLLCVAVVTNSALVNLSSRPPVLFL